MGRFQKIKQFIARNVDETGQAIVIIALTMVVMLAFVGIAVDGGGLYFLQIDTQNTADSAAITAAFSLCTASEAAAKEVAFNVAGRNGYLNTSELPNVVTVDENYVPGGGADPNLKYIEVIITAEKPSYFIQAVFPGELVVTGRSVGVCNDGDSGGVLSESSVVATSQNCTDYPNSGNQGSLRMTGQGQLITTGGVFVNAACAGVDTTQAKGQGSASLGGYGLCNRGTTLDSKGSIVATDPEGQLIENCPEDQVSRDPYGSYLNKPNCAALPLGNGTGSLQDGVNTPGRYTSFSNAKKDTSYLISGVYCLQTDMDIKGNVTGSTAANTPGGSAPGDTEGVFIYMEDPYMNLKMTNTGAALSLKAFNSTTTHADKDLYQGVLMYMPSDATGGGANAGIVLRTQALDLEGLIYAPYQKCDIAGNSYPNQIIGQIVCGVFDNTGQANLFVDYQSPPFLDVKPSIAILE